MRLEYHCYIWANNWLNIPFLHYGTNLEKLHYDLRQLKQML